MKLSKNQLRSIIVREIALINENDGKKLAKDIFLDAADAGYDESLFDQLVSIYDKHGITGAIGFLMARGVIDGAMVAKIYADIFSGKYNDVQNISDFFDKVELDQKGFKEKLRQGAQKEKVSLKRR